MRLEIADLCPFKLHFLEESDIFHNIISPSSKPEASNLLNELYGVLAILVMWQFLLP